MSKIDLVIRNGELVTAQGSLGPKDIGVCDGSIIQIGGSIDGDVEIDANNRLILPGGIDAHVHLSVPPEEENEYPRWVDDFSSGSAAALAGGITTLGNITFPGKGESPLSQLKREMEVAQKQIITDLFLHPVIGDISSIVLEEIPKLLEFGCNSIKIFTVSSKFDTNNISFLTAINLAGKNGLITLIHCEDYSIIEYLTDRLVESGKSSIEHYSESRPIVAEVVSTQRAVAIAEVTNSPLYVVHLSSKRALDVCIEAKARNLPINIETRPLYLFFTSERLKDIDGAKFVGQPPLREAQDVDALWKGIQQGFINTVCTDHAPWSLAAKLDSSHTIANIRPGVADLQTMMPLLYSEGVISKRISLSRFVQVTSTNASKLFGLYPQKGTIQVGSDADLVIFNPALKKKINKSMLISNSDYSPYENWEVVGWPETTLRRGEIVYQDGKILGKPGSGQIVKRGKTMPL